MDWWETKKRSIESRVTAVAFENTVYSGVIHAIVG